MQRLADREADPEHDRRARPPRSRSAADDVASAGGAPVALLGTALRAGSPARRAVEEERSVRRRRQRRRPLRRARELDDRLERPLSAPVGTRPRARRG